MKKYRVLEVPEAFFEDFGGEHNDQMQLRIVEEGALLTHLNNKKLYLPIKALAIVSLISAVVFFLVFNQYNLIPLTGEKSIATIVIIVGWLTGMGSFVRYFSQNKKAKEKTMSQGIYWRNFPTVFVSFSVLLVLILLFLFRILGQLFVGANFDIYTSTVIAVLFVAVVNLGMINIARSLTPSLLIKSLITIILGGVSIAMITNKDQQWWLHNLSFLGTPEATNAWQFNLTLMLSAFLMVALIDYLFVLLYETMGKTWNLRIFKALLVITAICLGGVGFFPYNESTFNQQMHNRSAGYLVYLFIILIVALRWLFPSISKRFLRFSYSIGLALLLAVVLFQGVNYLSLTAFELIAFVLAFTWLLMLLKILVDIVMHLGNVYDVRIVIQEDVKELLVEDFTHQN